MPRGYRVSTCKSKGSGELRSANDEGVGDTSSVYLGEKKEKEREGVLGALVYHEALQLRLKFEKRS